MNLAKKKLSDDSVYKEIFIKRIYEKKDFKIEADDIWIDVGGYTGLFSKYALSKGAKVRSIYEPFTRMNKEISENAPGVEIINKAVDIDDSIKTFYIHPEGNFQRNTLYNHYKRIKMVELRVEGINFKDIIEEGICVKMDIEGAELKIMDDPGQPLGKIKKLVLEYHLDKDWNIDHYYKRIERLKQIFSQVYYDKLNKNQKRIFPSGRIIYCIR